MAELIGLNYEGNSVAGEDGTIDQSDLNQIRQVEWKRRKDEGEWLTVIGTATLSDGSVLILEISLKKRDGVYVLTGAVG